MAGRRLTRTPLRARTRAPRLRLTVTIAGRSSGVSPTANGDGEQERLAPTDAPGRCPRRTRPRRAAGSLATRAARSSGPRARSRSGELVPAAGGRFRPYAVREPVAVSSTCPSRSRRSCRSRRTRHGRSGFPDRATLTGRPSGWGPTRRSALNSSTNRWFASMTRPSAGTMSPALRTTTSPRTRSRTGRSIWIESRITVAWSARRARSAATAPPIAPPGRSRGSPRGGRSPG